MTTTDAPQLEKCKPQGRPVARVPPRVLRAALVDAIERIRIPHEDDLARHPGIEMHHEQSVAFLAAHGLVPDAKVRRYLDHAAVAEGMAIALPDVGESQFQLAVDWTYHNCLHDDAIESSDCSVSQVAKLSRAYSGALLGHPSESRPPPLVSAMVSWRRRALALGVDAGLLTRFAERAGHMALQFVCERQRGWIDEGRYLRWRVEAGPFDAWFALLDLVWGRERRPDTPRAATLRMLAIRMTVVGNELRSAAREFDQKVTNNAIVRAEDPLAAIEQMVVHHQQAVERFEALGRALRDPRHDAYARALARAVYATHAYELRSVRGCAWSSHGSTP